MAIRSYSPTDVSVLLAGFLQVDGFVDGTFITISKDVQPYKTRRVADGSVARTYINDATYTIELVLASTSPTNDVLTKLYQLDAITQYGKFPFFLKDELGTSLFIAPTCWIKEIPDLSFSNGVEQRVWRIQASQGGFNIGGNEDASAIIQDLLNAGAGVLEGL